MVLRVTFIGTGSMIPTAKRGQTTIFCNLGGENMLLECGEGSQRQMMRFGTGFGISSIFVTHVQRGHVLGLPGLLQTLDYNHRTDPLQIHTPQGTYDDIQKLVEIADPAPSFPVRINEVQSDAVVLQTDDVEVRTFETTHETNTVGYVFIEDERKGRFNREKAEKLGVPVGPKFSQLHEGQSVELDDGRVIESDQVVGPPRPGRKIVYTGKTRPTESIIHAAEDADLLIHNATFDDEHTDRARELNHSTAREVAKVAAEAGAKRLAMVHISSRYAGSVGGHNRQARDVFDGEIFVPDDGQTVEIPYPEAPERDTASEDVDEQLEKGPTARAAPSTTSDPAEQSLVDENVSGTSSPDRTEVQTSRIVRDSQLVTELKEHYSYRCQVCDERRLRTLEEGYAEAHHLKPLGQPHDGPDTAQNLLVLCPNHHADFDHGLIAIDPDSLQVASLYEEEIDGSQLECSDSHPLSREFINYHNSKIYIGDEHPSSDGE